MRTKTRRIDAATVKAAIPPGSFYAREIGAHFTRESGWVDPRCTCPFHEDRRPGSFRVNLSTGGYVCFACQARGGGVIDFLMARYQIGFREALGRLTTWL